MLTLSRVLAEPMATRRITGVVRNIQDLPWSNAKILFELLAPSFTADTQYPISLQEVRTNAAGQLSVDLWCNGSGLAVSAYRCTMPDSEQFIFTLEAGLPQTFTQLRTLGTPVNQSTASLMAYITAQITAQIVSIGGGGGGSIPDTYQVLAFAGNNSSLTKISAAPQLSRLFFNGGKQQYGVDYTINGSILTWLSSSLLIEPTDLLEIIFS